jgi:hypothetical protein
MHSCIGLETHSGGSCSQGYRSNKVWQSVHLYVEFNKDCGHPGVWIFPNIMSTSENMLRIERDTLERRLDELLITFRKVNKSRDKYMQLSEEMRAVIVDMLLSTKGWDSDKDIDQIASDILREYKRERHGYD